MQLTDLSFVQYQILGNFIKADSLSYSRGKPDTVSNDLYKYHLKYLIDKGVIDKIGRQYRLSVDGLKLVHTLTSLGQPVDMFQVSVLLIVANPDSQPPLVLLHQRTRQPYLGETGTVSGKLRPGEEITDAMQRKLTEETGLSGSFKHIGIIRKLRHTASGQLFQDTFYHLGFCFNPAGNLQPQTTWGKNLWIPLNQLDSYLSPTQVLTGDLINQIITGRGNLPFFFRTDSATISP